MRSTVIRIEINKPFLGVYETLKKRIVEEGFLLLHEINTQKIVAGHGVNIPALRQLLFFEPKYIEQIMKSDTLAINDIPMKLVLLDMENGKTDVSFQNPTGSLKDYNLDTEMLEELLSRINNIMDF
ncbi:MAG: DUF302 domain-containing protein [Bacteroidota bacterium]